MEHQTELPGTATTSQLREQRVCTKCKGGKTLSYGGYQRQDGSWAPVSTYRCHCCNGTGTFDAPDVPAILKEIAGRKGLRSHRPASARAYYVWRMARFNGGADVTLPMVAMSEVHGDPFRAVLDAVADAVAKREFGTDRAAAHRWGPLLANNVPHVKSLPPTAYETGPVLSGVAKPKCEMAELGS